MPLLIVILALGVFGYMAISRIGSTLTRDCVWRQDRRVGQGAWQCLACGARTDLAAGKRPRHCLRPKG